MSLNFDNGFIRFYNFHIHTATFIIPYLVMLFIVGIPLFYLESTLGQSLQRGPIKVWYKICPNLWGIGLAGVIVTTIIRIYYNIIIGWVLLYFFHSFQNPLPWSECGGYHVQPKYEDNFHFLNSSVNRSDYRELLSCVNDSTRYDQQVIHCQLRMIIKINGIAGLVYERNPTNHHSFTKV